MSEKISPQKALIDFDVNKHYLTKDLQLVQKTGFLGMINRIIHLLTHQHDINKIAEKIEQIAHSFLSENAQLTTAVLNNLSALQDKFKEGSSQAQVLAQVIESIQPPPSTDSESTTSEMQTSDSMQSLDSEEYIFGDPDLVVPFDYNCEVASELAKTAIALLDKTAEKERVIKRGATLNRDEIQAKEEQLASARNEENLAELFYALQINAMNGFFTPASDLSEEVLDKDVLLEKIQKIFIEKEPHQTEKKPIKQIFADYFASQNA